MQRKRIRINDAHHTSCRLADRAHTIVLEDLNFKGMAKSAKSMVEEPGANVGVTAEPGYPGDWVVAACPPVGHGDRMHQASVPSSFDQPNICIQPLTGHCDPHLGLYSKLRAKVANWIA